MAHPDTFHFLHSSARPRPRRSSLAWPVLLVTALACASCTPSFYRKSADKETFSILREKSAEVENVEPDSIGTEEEESIDLTHLETSGSGAEFLGEMAEYERSAKVISLDEALATGIRHGREYLNEKEAVFLSALDLTLARHELAPIFTATGTGLRQSDLRTAELEEGMTELVATNTFSRNERGTFSMLQRTGARLSADFTRDFFRILSGNRSLNDSALAVTLAQPLLRGAGSKVTLEALTQAERNVLYDLRDFANFRRSFIVAVVSDYYGVLRARDRVQNNWVAYQGFLKNIQREEALAEEDRRTQTELGQLRQATLQSESRWVDSVRAYQNQLDELKITLGVPVDEQLILDDAELRRIGIESPGITRDEAVEVALVTRPDLATVRDQVEDAERRIEVSKNGLLPGLDIDVRYDVASSPDDTTPGLNPSRRAWSSSFDLDLPLDRKAERNDYRSRFIFLQRAKRAAELQKERVRLEIYDDWRAIEQARRNYEIAEQGVELAERRLEEQRLLAELGRGEARDLVDAQNDLVDAQNQRTATLVDHTLARLRLWRDMGILYIKNDGGWIRKLERESA